MRERIATAKDQGASRDVMITVPLRPLAPDFTPVHIPFDGWLRAADRCVFHHFQDRTIAACGARRKSNHTALTCRGYTLCHLCKEAIEQAALPPAPLTPAMRRILANLQNRRPWHDGLMAIDTAHLAITAMEELVGKGLVKRGPVWLSPKGRRRLEAEKGGAS